MMSIFGTQPIVFALLYFSFQFVSLGHTANNEESLQPKKIPQVKGYAHGHRLLVECLNRTVDTGEHITNANGELQYIPFPTCNETGKPLEIVFGSEQDINCTILTLPDPLFHLLEFYIHNDAPLSCRLPSRPVSSSLTPPRYIHLQFALTGTLQLSHLHINPSLNVLLHTAVTETPRSDSNYEILAATAYSLPSPASSHRLVIGDPLPLQLSVRWYNSRLLPPSTSKVSGLGRHVYLVNIVYCLLSFATGGAVGLAYWRGWELPRRLKRYNREMAGGEGGKGYAWPGSASTGLGDAFAIGKRD